MTVFEYLTVAISIIVGLAIARVLTALTDLFAHRRHAQIFWVPIAWAVAFFFLLLINWWQMFTVSETLTEWSFLDFSLPIMQVVALFVGSSLILPRNWLDSSIDLYDYYCDQGRWGVAGYSIFFFLAIPTNIRLWGGSSLLMNMLVAGILTACLGAIFSRTRRQASAWTIAFIVVQMGTWRYVIFPTLGN